MNRSKFAPCLGPAYDGIVAHRDERTTMSTEAPPLEEAHHQQGMTEEYSFDELAKRLDDKR